MKNNIYLYIASTLLLLLTASVHANSPSPGDNCSVQIARYQALTKRFQNLNFKVSKNRDQGAVLDVDAIQLIESFDPKAAPAKCRKNLWQSVVMLAIAQAPFDMESQAATLLALRLAQNEDLQSSYQAMLKKSTDRCRSNLLATVTQEKLCQMKANPNPALDPEENTDCHSSFNYEDCIQFKF